MWRLISRFELATGMRVNMKKTEGLRCGRLARKPVPLLQELGTSTIKWVQEGEYVRLLGIPFWESGKYDVDISFRALYDKCKSKIAAWTDHPLLTQVGRSMLVNAMIYSRFRYWAQCMALPRWLNEAILSDTSTTLGTPRGV